MKSVKERVEEALVEIRPFLEKDGGNVTLISVLDETVTVRFEGNCQSCSINQVTLKAGIEMTIKKHAPEITTVIAEEL